MTSRAPKIFVCSLCLALVSACDGASEPTETPALDAPPAGASQAEEEDPPVSAWTDGRIRGLASMPDKGVAPPAGSKIQISLWESDRETFDSKVIQTHEVELSGAAPWAFEFSLEQGAFNEKNGYGVSAMVVDDTGEAWFMSQPVSVFRAEEPDAAIEIALDPARPESVSE